MIEKILAGLAGLGVLAATAIPPQNGADVPFLPAPTSQQQATTAEVTGTIDGKDTVFTTETSELTVRPTTSPELPQAKLETLAPSIRCGLNVQHVHPSTHVNGSINGVAKINCTGNAGRLTLHYTLIRVSPNPKQWGAGSVTVRDRNSLQNNKGIRCSEGPGSFRGWAQGEISPPPGYQLEGPATYSKYGDTRSVMCGASRIASNSNSTDGEQTLSVNFVRSDLVSHP